jgi:hypothetical protein
LSETIPIIDGVDEIELGAKINSLFEKYVVDGKDSKAKMNGFINQIPFSVKRKEDTTRQSGL